MSYILDALKRADAERERGAVPGLHAQPADMALPDDPRGMTLPPWAWGLAGLGVALLGMLAWSMWRGGETPEGNGPPQPPGMMQPGQGQQPGAWTGTGERAQGNAGMASGAWGPQGGMQRPQHDARMPRGEARTDGLARPDGHRRFMPQPDATPASNGARLTARAEANAAEPEASTEARPTHRRMADPASGGQPDSTTSARSTNAAASATTSRVYALGDLPDNVRRSLPQLVIGGAMYSDNPGSRMLVINSQLFHEGDKLGPELTLEEIKLKSAVLRYRNYRYSVTY